MAWPSSIAFNALTRSLIFCSAWSTGDSLFRAAQTYSAAARRAVLVKGSGLPSTSMKVAPVMVSAKAS